MRKFFREKNGVRFFGLILIEAVLVVGGIYLISKVTRAGVLTPSASPAGSMRTIQEIYAALAATSTVNASSSAASSTGNAIQIAECIITRLTGGSCP